MIINEQSGLDITNKSQVRFMSVFLSWQHQNKPLKKTHQTIHFNPFANEKQKMYIN